MGGHSAALSRERVIRITKRDFKLAAGARGWAVAVLASSSALLAFPGPLFLSVCRLQVGYPASGAMDPTPTELAAIVNVDQVYTLASIPGDITQPETLRGGLAQGHRPP